MSSLPAFLKIDKLSVLLGMGSIGLLGLEYECFCSHISTTEHEKEIAHLSQKCEQQRADCLFLAEHTQTIAALRTSQEEKKKLSLPLLEHSLSAYAKACHFKELTLTYEKKPSNQTTQHPCTLLIVEFLSATEEEACAFIKKVWKQYRFFFESSYFSLQAYTCNRKEEACIKGRYVLEGFLPF